MCLRRTRGRADLGTGRDGTAASRRAPRSRAGARVVGIGIDRALASLLRLVIALYRYLLSPFLPQTCRYAPTCSAYAAEALQMHGALVGSWLALRRLVRCHPWGGWGFDPVPTDPQPDRARQRHSPVPDAPEPIGPPA